MAQQQAAPPAAYPYAQPPPNPYAAVQPPQQAPPPPVYYPTPAVPETAPNYMGPGIAPDGRKIGRNKDADAIVNSADLYFAQLKRDSTTRNYARYAGDDEKANAVFHHPSIEQIKMHVNPYLLEQKEKERELLETAPEEMLIFQEYEAKPKKPKSYAGVSYKEKLAQQKARKEGKPVPPSQRELQAQKEAEEERRRIAIEGEVPKVIPAVPEEYIAKFESPLSPQAALVNAPAEPEISEPVAEPPPPPLAAPTTTPAETVSRQDDVLTGDTRQDIRTLMGLMLKHRGGPGFGAGRLQGTEAERLEALAKAIPDVLRQEEQVAPAPLAPQSVSSPAAAPAQNSRVPSMIACIEGAVTMYKNSPPELQGSVLVALRAALLSALETLSQVIGTDGAPIIASSEAAVPPSSLSQEQSQKVMSMVAVIEGAVTMYKNSPESLQASILGTLNVALMSAVNTCNQILAVGTVRPQATAPAAPPVAAAESVAAPAQPATPQYSGNDPNTKMLEDIYGKVVNAGGDGKMGLRSDLSAKEAQDLQNSLTDMRTLLVDELHSGIPGEHAPAPEGDDASTTEPPTSTASKYKQMLEKTRAEKESKDGFQ